MADVMATLTAAFDTARDGSAAQWDAKRAVLVERAVETGPAAEKGRILAALADHDGRREADNTRLAKQHLVRIDDVAVTGTVGDAVVPA